jgi:hypothetical protein
VLKSASDAEFSIHVEERLNPHPFQHVDPTHKSRTIGRQLVKRAQDFLVEE